MLSSPNLEIGVPPPNLILIPSGNSDSSDVVVLLLEPHFPLLRGLSLSVVSVVVAWYLEFLAWVLAAGGGASAPPSAAGASSPGPGSSPSQSAQSAQVQQHCGKSTSVRTAVSTHSAKEAGI